MSEIKKDNVIASPAEFLEEIKKETDPVTRREMLKRMGYTFGAVSTMGMLGTYDANALTTQFLILQYPTSISYLINGVSCPASIAASTTVARVAAAINLPSNVTHETTTNNPTVLCEESYCENPPPPSPRTMQASSSFDAWVDSVISYIRGHLGL